MFFSGRGGGGKRDSGTRAVETFSQDNGVGGRDKREKCESRPLGRVVHGDNDDRGKKEKNSMGLGENV